ncbi:hypothetical protein F5X96DRAFT_435421 [Biscogniauxia mediterranea]|nr:hypothetical protein F5X96DRAFT_435421 [Biscogniauxia mediterranea]
MEPSSSSTSSSSFSPSHYFPQRRRVLQACMNCSKRKTRCDGAKPKCSLCMTQNVECVYRDAPQPRIEQNTRILLERIQLLEDRLMSSPIFTTATSNNPAVGSGGAGVGVAAVTPTPSHTSSQPDINHHSSSPGLRPQQDRLVSDPDVPIPLSHTANANHVYRWPIVQQLLSSQEGEGGGGGVRGAGGAGGGGERRDPTDPIGIFFEPSSSRVATLTPTESWRLFRGYHLPCPAKTVAEYHHLVDVYFAEITMFFPLLAPSEVLETLEVVATSELGGGEHRDDHHIPPARYALLLLVLCLSSFVAQGKSLIHASGGSGSGSGANDRGAPPPPNNNEDAGLDQHLWTKAKLLLGYISSELSLEAAQCAMLASIYMGARGRVAKSFHWAQAAAVKCEALVRMPGTNRIVHGEFSDAFRRLYWVAFIYEGDFGSEIEITGPSGIAKYEDLVPYPVFGPSSSSSSSSAHAPPPESNTANNNTNNKGGGGGGGGGGDVAASSSPMPIHSVEELIAFQISTNAAIRRFLNRVNGLIYNSKEQYRMTRSDYATWLMRVTDDLWSHHTAIYRNVPDFLLTSRPPPPPQHHDHDRGEAHHHQQQQASSSFLRAHHALGNNPWNVLRLKGRYYAGQYIIHRPFVEYVLLNLPRFESHPCRAAVLDKCSSCLEGCRGFVRVFDTDQVNSITCLFGTGMLTFAMVIVLRVCTVVPVFAPILPQDVEEAIFLGKRNLQRFSASIREFQWHLRVLEQLDDAARAANLGMMLRLSP